METVFCIVFCALLPVLWGTALLIQKKRGKKTSPARILMSFGGVVMGIGNVLHGFECLPRVPYLIITLVGFSLMLAAFTISMKQNEF